MVLNRVFFILVVLFFPFSLIATEKEQLPETKAEVEEVVEVGNANSVPLSRVFLFPFEIPPIVFGFLSKPLSWSLDWVERVHLPQRLVDFFSNEDRTFFWYPTFRTGGQGGLYGLEARHRKFTSKEYEIGARFMLSPALDMDGFLSMQNLRIPAFESTLTIKSSYRRRVEEAFFGLGNDSSDTSFPHEERLLRSGLAARQDLSKGFYFLLSVDAVYSDLRDLASDPLTSNFPVTEIEGINEKIFAGDGRLSLGFLPYEGKAGFEALGMVNYYQGTNHFRYALWSLRLRQSFELLHPRHTLAFSTKIESVHRVNEGRVPFSNLPSLGGSSVLRAYRSNRFQDDVSWILASDYTWPLGKIMDAVLFYETGRVASEISKLSVDGWKNSYGGGLSFGFMDFSLFELLVGHGEEGVRVWFSLSQGL